MLKSLQILVRFFSTTLCSCSEEAATFLFGQKANQVKIVKNGINLNEYMMLPVNTKACVLHELDLAEDVRLIGHIGRFSEAKNHLFLLNVLKKLVEIDNRYIAILIGDGPLRTMVEKKAEELGVKKHIHFLGVRTDVARWMSAFDVFVFPSRHEGFGNVMIEAQSAGTPCVASTSVSESTDIGLGLVQYISLKAPVEAWCEKVMEAVAFPRPSQQRIEKKISTSGFNIQDHVQDWLKLYGLQGAL